MPQAVAAACWSAARLSAGGGAVLGFAWSPDPCLTPPPHSSFPGSRVQLPACAVCPGSLGFPVFLGVWVESGGVCAPILCSKTTSAVVAARASEVLTSAVGGGGQGSGALPSAACSSPPQGGPAASPSPPYATPPCRVMGAWASGPSQAGAQAPGPGLPRVPLVWSSIPQGPGAFPPQRPTRVGTSVSGPARAQRGGRPCLLLAVGTVAVRRPRVDSHMRPGAPRRLCPRLAGQVEAGEARGQRLVHGGLGPPTQVWCGSGPAPCGPVVGGLPGARGGRAWRARGAGQQEPAEDLGRALARREFILVSPTGRWEPK